jgi:CubicO group peptidase (beta-lactamase class C family)
VTAPTVSGIIAQQTMDRLFQRPYPPVLLTYRMHVTNDFPPPPEHLVTLANWRTPPFNRWAFNHVCELVASAAIYADPLATKLETGHTDLDDFAIRFDGEDLNLDRWLDRTFTDSLVILKNGKIIHEYYASGQSPGVSHIWMSVSKSILGLMAGIVVDRFDLDVNRPIVDLIPEARHSAFDGASIRDALDMRVGIRFDEDYHAKTGPIIEYRKAQGWDPLGPGETPGDLRSFLCSLTERDGPHNDRFHYVSPNTDLLGWVLERASGVRYADLLSEYLWKPVRAERDAYITVDRFGAPRAAGGLCATPRDMARIGRLLVTGGTVDAVQVIPRAWIDDILGFDGRHAWLKGDFHDLFDQADMHYRSQWYVQRGDRPLVHGVGVFGQHIFVDPAADLVIAKCSSLPLPLDKSDLLMNLAGVDVLRQIV